MYKNKYLAYIHHYWNKSTQNISDDFGTSIGLPFPFISPNIDKYTDLYYWDSYFHVLGLIKEKKVALAKNIVDDFIYLINRFGIIPNANSFYFLSRSQPPFLTSMILEVFKHTKDLDWLYKASSAAIKEYEEVWTSKHWKNSRQIYDGLSRYYDINDIDFLAELESGWDLTSRFEGHCLDILPIDLNCLLYKYETDFIKIGRLLNQSTIEINRWKDKAESRKNSIQKLMWNEKTGFFHDYDYKSKKQTKCLSLAAYFTLYFKVATQSQAKKLQEKLKHFEFQGGLATTTTKKNIRRDQYSAGKTHTQQWDYPNGWAPLQYITIMGLQQYRFTNDALRISKKWLKTCELNFDKHGHFLEKYNVVNPEKPARGHYDTQGGFGWTNAVYLLLYSKFKNIANGLPKQ